MRLAAVVLGILAVPVCAQSTLPSEVLLLARIKHHAEADLSRLPNFTCLETIERSTRNSPLKPFHVSDVVRVEVAHVGERELFAWPGASNFESQRLAEMVGSGMTSNGEYSTHASAVFVNTTAVIHYAGEEEAGGHHAARYEYEISPAFSGYTMHVNGRTAAVGVRGSFWADTTTFDLLRLTVEGTLIPDELGVRAVLTDIDYGRLRIGSTEFLLPQSSTVWMGLASGRENRNRIDFTHCRQYTTESVLSFGETPPAGVPASQGAVEFTLPPGLTVSLRLETPLAVATAKIGDPVSASLHSDLKRNGELIAPKGSIISGRLRVLQKFGALYVAGLELTDLAVGNSHARFIAKLVSVDSKYAQTSATSTSLVDRMHIAGRVETRSVERDLPPELPGVGTFFINAGVAHVPAGMLMQWQTVGIGK